MFRCNERESCSKMRLVIFLSCFLFGFTGLTQAAFQSYVAAVVEYYPPPVNTDPDTKLEENIDRYRGFIRDASKKGAQIIVFPEYGVTDWPVENLEQYSLEVPDVKSPGPYPNLLTMMSDAAKEYHIYTVLNVLEKAENDKGKTVYYNTDIVFDKKGLLIAKYRAVDTGNVRGLTAGFSDQPDSVFDTDFNVRFGLIGSNDIPSYKPSIARLNNVTDLILTSSRSSYLPFLHTVSTQLGYAMANNVNLLAAGLANAEKGQSGSGIYGASGTIYSVYISGKSSEKLLIGTLEADQKKLTPFKPQSLSSLGPDATPDYKKLVAVRKFSHNLYKFAHVDLKQRNIKTNVCHGKLCCNFEINVTEDVNTSEFYKVVAYNGVDEIGGKKEKIRLCALVACESNEPNSCATIDVTSSTKFDGISVQFNAKDMSNKWIQPVLLRKDLLPIMNTTFQSYSINGNRRTILKSDDQDDLLVFGLIAQGGASSVVCSVFFVVLCGITVLFFE